MYKDGFKPSSRLDWKIVETFLGDYRLNCAQLVDMHHTQNSGKQPKAEFLQKTRALDLKIQKTNQPYLPSTNKLQETWI